MKPVQQNLRLQIIVTSIGIALFLLKVLAWYLTKSVAVLTDALESTVNVAAGLIGVYSLYLSAKPRDKEHPYGHGKVEFISAAVEGTLIIVAACIIIYKSVKSFMYPQVVSKLDYGIILISITALVNYVAGAICIKTGNRNNSLALIASGKHLQTDTISTLGIVIGLIVMYFVKVDWLDGAVALLFALLILVTGYKIIRSSIAGIMDEADMELLEKLVQTLNKNRRENWMDLHNLRIIKYGATIHIDCHLTVPWYLNVHEAHKEIDALSTLVKNKFGDSMELFVHSDGCLDFSCRICDKEYCIYRKNPFQKRIEWTLLNISTNAKHTVNT